MTDGPRGSHCPACGFLIRYHPTKGCRLTEPEMIAVQRVRHGTSETDRLLYEGPSSGPEWVRFRSGLGAQRIRVSTSEAHRGPGDADAWLMKATHYYLVAKRHGATDEELSNDEVERTSEADREPQPTDGPDYHAEHQAWKERQLADELQNAGEVRKERDALRTENARLRAALDGTSESTTSRTAKGDPFNPSAPLDSTGEADDG